MAKGNLNGVIRRKLGNMVGQANKLVNGKDKQVWRVYQGSVSNPKTIKQAQQRSLFVAAKNFQQAFRGILDHSWQGVEYGTRSLNYFRKMVLANGGANFPTFSYQSKGSQLPIPQPWPVSRGSLVIPGSQVTYNDDEKWFETGFGKFDFEATENSTIGQWDAALLAANPMLNDGDMITILSVYAATNMGFDSVTLDTPLVPVYDRHVIDTSNETRFTGSVETERGIFSLSVLFAKEDAAINSLIYPGIDVAAAIIVSRQNGSKASWLRTNSNMVVATEIANLYGSNDYITAALDSFMQDDAAATSDWYLNETGQSEETTGGAVGSSVIRERQMSITQGDGTNLVTAAYYSSGSRNGFLYKEASTGVRRQYFTIQGRTLIGVELAEGASFGTTDLINLSIVENDLNSRGYIINPVDQIIETPD